MRNLLWIALFAVCLTAFAGMAWAEAPQCASDFVAPVAEDIELSPAEGEAEDPVLEQILADSPEEPLTKAIDSGICCSSSSSCPTASGYAKWCSSGSCPSQNTCLYRRL